MRYAIALLLLLASAARADIGVVVSSTGTVISKEVYAGDTSRLVAFETARQVQDPSLTFNNIPLPSAAFDAVTVPTDQALRTQLLQDRFNIQNSTNTAAQKLQALIDLLQIRGVLN